MIAPLQHIDAFLHGRALYRADQPAAPRARWFLLMILFLGPLYGVCMGSYSVANLDRVTMMLLVAIKVPLLLLATTLICLPGYFAFNTILGLRDDWSAALQAILAGQAAVSIALVSLAPLTQVWYWSGASYRGAILFNALAFGTAAVAGQIAMRRYYRPLILRRPAHRLALALWIGLYAFVGIQMGWMLRPFIGSPDMPVAFFRQEPFSNAYLVVMELIFG
ncbi:MAG: hypothetical protein AB7N71_05710 [Phycisphaerae bacterium]